MVKHLYNIMAGFKSSILAVSMLIGCTTPKPQLTEPIVDETAILYPSNGDPDEAIPEELVNLCLERFAYPYVSEVHQAWHCFNLLEQGPCDSSDKWFVVDYSRTDKNGNMLIGCMILYRFCIIMMFS